MKRMKLLILLSMYCMSLIAPPLPVMLPVMMCEPLTDTSLLNWSNIERYMSIIDIREPEIIMAQIRHETGNLTSRFCKEQNNLFGMRLARSRETTAIGEGNHMAKYRTWQESLKDYKIWQDKFYKGGDYYQFLSRHGYATDPFYLWKLKKNLKKQMI